MPQSTKESLHDIVSQDALVYDLADFAAAILQGTDGKKILFSRCTSEHTRVQIIHF